MALSIKGFIALFTSTVISRLATELTFTVNPVDLTESTPAEMGAITLLERLNSDSIKHTRTHQLELEATDDGNAHTASYTFGQQVNNNPECDPSFSTEAGKLMLVRKQ
uniref:Uncharacterized protein n=1 Tax=Sphaerodactylus townsendi TaxID=933632 RepID=A0ACB8FQP8_9SAUR